MATLLYSMMHGGGECIRYRSLVPCGISVPENVEDWFYIPTSLASFVCKCLFVNAGPSKPGGGGVYAGGPCLPPTFSPG